VRFLDKIAILEAALAQMPDWSRFQCLANCVPRAHTATARRAIRVLGDLARGRGWISADQAEELDRMAQPPKRRATGES